MTSLRRRQDDDDDSNEHLRRESNPALWDVQLGWGSKRLSVRGLSITLLLGVCAVIASNIYASNDLRVTMKEIAKVATTEHGALVNASERLACVVSLTLEDRKLLRENYYRGAFSRYCPWMVTE